MDQLSAQRAAGAVIATNRNLRIRSWNAEAERAYGWAFRDVEGKNLDELLHTAYTGMSLEQAYSALFERGSIELEALHTDRSGSVINERGNAWLTRDDDGRITGVMLVFSAAGLLSSAKASSGDDAFPSHGAGVAPILPEDLGGDVWVYDIAQNSEWHARGNAAVSVHPNDSGAAGDAIRAAIKGKKSSFSAQYRTLSDHGDAWSLTQGRIQYDGAGRAVRITGTTVDIAALKSMEEQLRLRESALERQAEEFADRSRQAAGFFTEVSHEIKTPLSIMLVNLQMMEYCLRDSGGDMNGRLVKAVAMMRQNTLKLLRLSGNLLDMTRLDAALMNARFINTDIVELASGLAASVSHYIAPSGIKVIFESPVATRLLPTDSDKLERILLNLLSNAAKHTPRGGHVYLTLRDAPDRVEICVSDDGSGIPQDKKELIQKRLRQAESSLAQASGGGGLGLLLTKALVELLRGRLWFESRLGEGSAFFVELPVLQADWHAPAPEADGMTRDRKVEMEFSDFELLAQGSQL